MHIYLYFLLFKVVINYKQMLPSLFIFNTSRSRAKVINFLFYKLF